MSVTDARCSVYLDSRRDAERYKKASVSREMLISSSPIPTTNNHHQQPTLDHHYYYHRLLLNLLSGITPTMSQPTMKPLTTLAAANLAAVPNQQIKGMRSYSFSSTSTSSSSVYSRAPEDLVDRLAGHTVRPPIPSHSILSSSPVVTFTLHSPVSTSPHLRLPSLSLPFQMSTVLTLIGIDNVPTLVSW